MYTEKDDSDSDYPSSSSVQNFNLFPQTFLKFHLSKKIKKLQTLKNFEFGSSSDSLYYFKPSKNLTLKFGPKIQKNAAIENKRSLNKVDATDD